MTTDATALRALSQALKLEQEGRSFYLRAVEETVEEAGKTLFRSLADDERMHAEIIQRQMQSLESESAFMAVPDLSMPAIDLNVKLFPPDLDQVVAKVGANPGPIQALHVALENEIKSFDLYRRAAEETMDAAGKQMYLWLASAELTHFNLLMTNYEDLAEGSGWA